MPNRAVTALVIAVAAVRPAGAQHIDGLRLGPVPVRVTTLAQDSTPHRAVVYGWRQPLLTVGGVFGGLGGFLGMFACEIGETDRNCAVLSEAFFLTSGLVGGVLGAMLGSSSRPHVEPAGTERRGDRRKYGALFWGIPSFALYGLLEVPDACSRSHERCNETIALGALSVALNAGIGYLIGKGIPAFRKIEQH